MTNTRTPVIIATLLMAVTMILTLTPTGAVEAAPPPGALNYQSWSGNVGVGKEKKLDTFYARDGDTLKFRLKDCGPTTTPSTRWKVRLNVVYLLAAQTVRTWNIPCQRTITLTGIDNPLNNVGIWYQFTATNLGPTIRNRSAEVRLQNWNKRP